jgi:hypothetical protein
MPKKLDFNPITGQLDLTTVEGSIPERTSDPVSPIPQTAWVLYTNSATGGGALKMLIGGFPLLASGAIINSYVLKYRTKEGTTVSAALS